MKSAPALALALLSFVLVPVFSARVAWAQDRAETVKVNGFPRTIEVHLPTGFSKDKTYPVVLALHGAGGDAAFMAQLTHFNNTADKYGFIVVYPNARDSHWTVPQNENVRPIAGLGIGSRRGGLDGSENPIGDRDLRVGGSPVPDILFFEDLLDQVESEYPVDESRIYATGLSDGGFMDFRLACELAGRIAAVAPVAATMPQSLSDTCTDWSFRPVPILMINGTSDPIVSYNGRIGFTPGYFLLSAKDTLKVWAKINDCEGKSQRTTLQPGSPSGFETHVETYSECKEGSEAILYSVVKAGHTWPGGEQYMPVEKIGKTSADFSANEIIWKFFAAHPMPAKQTSSAQ